MTTVYLNERDANEEIERLLRAGEFVTIHDAYNRYITLTGKACDEEAVLCIQNIWVAVKGADSLATSDAEDDCYDEDYYSSEYYSEDYY